MTRVFNWIWQSPEIADTNSRAMLMELGDARNRTIRASAVISGISKCVTGDWCFLARKKQVHCRAFENLAVSHVVKFC
jgi:hypothetical protein